MLRGATRSRCGRVKHEEVSSGVPSGVSIYRLLRGEAWSGVRKAPQPDHCLCKSCNANTDIPCVILPTTVGIVWPGRLVGPREIYDYITTNRHKHGRFTNAATTSGADPVIKNSRHNCSPSSTINNLGEMVSYPLLLCVLIFVWRTMCKVVLQCRAAGGNFNGGFLARECGVQVWSR